VAEVRLKLPALFALVILLAPLPAIAGEHAYQRVDFQLRGSKCVACIRRVIKKLQKEKGVMKVDISIFPPYWGVVLLDKEKTDFERAFERVKKEDFVKSEKVERKDLDEVPPLVIPRKNVSDRDEKVETDL